MVVAKMDARIKFIENFLKNRKGQIDPRWILIIIMFVLFILWMRVKGWI